MKHTATFLVTIFLAATGVEAKPLKVYILAGQSNMEGHAEVRTFDYIGKDPLTAPILKEMRNPDGMPRVCDRCIHKLSVNELDYRWQRAHKAGRA